MACVVVMGGAALVALALWAAALAVALGWRVVLDGGAWRRREGGGGAGGWVREAKCPTGGSKVNSHIYQDLPPAPRTITAIPRGYTFAAA